MATKHKISYLSNEAPALQLRIQDDPEILVKFIDKMVTLDPERASDQEVIAILDNLIETRPNIAQLIRKIDPNKAEAVAKKFKKEMEEQNSSEKGAATTFSSLQKRFAAQAPDVKMAMIREGVPEAAANAAIAEMAKDGLQIVQTGEPPAPMNTEGFQVGAVVDPPGPVSVQPGASVPLNNKGKIEATATKAFSLANLPKLTGNEEAVE